MTNTVAAELAELIETFDSTAPFSAWRGVRAENVGKYVIDNAETILAALTKPAVPDVREVASKAIYEHWAFGRWEPGDKPAWVEGGNSDMQHLARSFADAALTQSPTCCEAERERCAKIAEELFADQRWDSAYSAAGNRIATAIRGADQ